MTGTAINFDPLAAGSSNEFLVSTSGNTGSFAGLGGTEGDLKSLVLGSGEVMDFMTFDADGSIRINLSEILRGVYGSEACFASPAAGQNCTPPVEGSGGPEQGFFNLTNTTLTSSTASLAMRGYAISSTGERSNFNGVLTAQFPDRNFQTLLLQLQEGSVSTSYSASLTGTFTPSPEIPEPGTYALLGTGLVTLFVAARRRAANKV